MLKANLFNSVKTWHNNQVQKAQSKELSEAQLQSRAKYQKDVAHIQGLVDELTLADDTDADKNKAPGNVSIESPLRPGDSRDATKELWRVGDTIQIQTVENLGRGGIDDQIKLDTLTYTLNPDGTIDVTESKFREYQRRQETNRSYVLDTNQEFAFTTEGGRYHA